MSPVPHTVTQRPSFYLILRILKNFHNFHELWEYYGQSHLKECYSCFNSKTFLSITVDKSCRHQMHLHSKIPSSFLHFFILSFQFPSMRLLYYLLSSLLLCHREKKSYVCTKSYCHIWHSNLCITVAPSGN